VLEDLLNAPGMEAYGDTLDRNPEALELLYTSKHPSVKVRFFLLLLLFVVSLC